MGLAADDVGTGANLRTQVTFDQRARVEMSRTRAVAAPAPKSTCADRKTRDLRGCLSGILNTGMNTLPGRRLWHLLPKKFQRREHLKQSLVGVETCEIASVPTRLVLRLNLAIG